ncbi:uncharacterized protein OCT59_012861 [Rhizophagus irregularis]|uniref:uncharacterized protein n=1 Tax=Rhizophagus irregularis TaxID=588596 RepID=UPI003320456E|nr:hypothetical protein OCT59_012861 [Rhizophagus irregularis]
MVMQNEEDTVIVKNIDAGIIMILSKKNNNIVDVTTDVGDDKETSGGYFLRNMKRKKIRIQFSNKQQEEFKPE